MIPFIVYIPLTLSGLLIFTYLLVSQSVRKTQLVRNAKQEKQEFELLLDDLLSKYVKDVMSQMNTKVYELELSGYKVITSNDNIMSKVITPEGDRYTTFGDIFLSMYNNKPLVFDKYVTETKH